MKDIVPSEMNNPKRRTAKRNEFAIGVNVPRVFAQGKAAKQEEPKVAERRTGGGKGENCVVYSRRQPLSLDQAVVCYPKARQWR